MRQVFGLPAYRRLLTAYGLNELTWSVGTIALAVLVYRRTGSALGSTAFFVSSQFLPAFLSPVLAVRLAGGAPRRVLPALYVVEAILFGVLAWMATHFSLVPVLAVALVDGAVAITARALSRAASVEVLRPHDLLHEGNAVINLVFSVAFFAGPALGGLVVAAGGTVAALLVDCGLFTVIALVLVTTPGLPAATPDEDGPQTLRRRLQAAVAHVRHDPTVRWLLILSSGGLVAFTISVPVEVVFAQHTLHAGPGGYGAILSAWGGGAVVGSAVYARWRRRPGRLLIAGAGACLAAGFAVMASAPGIVVAVIGSALGGIGNGVNSVAVGTMVQEYTSQRWMALVMSLNESLSQAAPGIGFVLGGAIATLADPRIALAVAAAGSLAFVVAVWVVLAPARVGPPPPGAPTPSGEPAAAPMAAEGRETLV